MIVCDQQNLDTTSLIICSPFNKPLVCHKIISRFYPELSQNATCKHFYNFIQVYFQQLQHPIIDYLPCSQWQSLHHHPVSQPGTELSLPSHPARPCPLPRPVKQLWSLSLKYVHTSLYPCRPSDSPHQLTRTTFILLTAHLASNLNSF